MLRRSTEDDEALLDRDRPPRSLNSSNSKYEEEDLARLDALTRNLLKDLDEQVGDGGDPQYRPFMDETWTSTGPHTAAQPYFDPRSSEHGHFESPPAPRPPIRSPNYIPPPPTRPLFDDGASKTTRGAAYSPSEHASWEDDRCKFDVSSAPPRHFGSSADAVPLCPQNEARLANKIISPLVSSVASPNRVRRERSTTADILEGRAAELASPSSSAFAAFRGDIPEGFLPNHVQATSSKPLYPQALPLRSTSREPAGAGPRSRMGPFANSAVNSQAEMSKWSTTTVSVPAPAP